MAKFLIKFKKKKKKNLEFFFEYLKYRFLERNGQQNQSNFYSFKTKWKCEVTSEVCGHQFSLYVEVNFSTKAYILH